MLHVAPEPPLAARLRSVPGIEYLAGDLHPAPGQLALDLRDLDLPDASFGLILCLHVLEHIDDDRRALRELRRVLRPGGAAILQVPRRRGPTLEDPSVTTPAERLARFGQVDHVRVYGDDYEDRLREAGFDVRVEVFRDELSPGERRRYGLPRDQEDDRLWEIVSARAASGGTP